MRLIQTLHIGKSKDIFQDGFGWFSPEYHLMSWTLSSLQLSKIYGNVELYANTPAARVLIDVLGLPYTNIFTKHDQLNIINESLWALPKIFTYKLQNEPFLHIDGDVFIFDKFRRSLLKGRLIAQNIEHATEYYTSTQKELVEHFTYFPKPVKNDFNSRIPISAVNAGIIGGNDVDFLREYSDLAFEYVNRNKKNLTKINTERFNVFFEQHLFYSLAKERGCKIELYFSETVNDNEYERLSEFHEVPYSKKYLHLLGHYKRDEVTCLQMSLKLRELYPEHYYKIISLCKKKSIPLSISLYYKEPLNSLKEYLQLQKKAKEKYNNSRFIGDSKLFGDKKIVDLSALLKFATSCLENLTLAIDKSEVENDFKKFTKSLNEFIESCNYIDYTYLYGRDLCSTKWYLEIFYNEKNVSQKKICKCEFVNIIESNFDWAGLYNKYKRVGVRYYDELVLAKGVFFNVAVLEISGSGFSLFDVDELELKILEMAKHPVLISDILLEMQSFVEDEVIKNNLKIFNSLVIKLIKQLVIKKILKPAY